MNRTRIVARCRLDRALSSARGGGVILLGLLAVPIACGPETDSITGADSSTRVAALAAADESQSDADFDLPPPFAARFVASDPGDYASNDALSLEVESTLDVEAELLVEVRALDETQSLRVTVPLGVVSAMTTSAFELPLGAVGLSAAALRVGGALKVLPRLRLSDGIVVTRPSGPLTLGYHFEGASVHVYDVDTRATQYSGGSLDGARGALEVFSPARVTQVSDYVGAPRPLDGEPDPDHDLAEEDR